MDLDPLVTVAVAARLCGVPRQTIHTWIRRGVLRVARRGPDGGGLPRIYLLRAAVLALNTNPTR